MAKCQLCENQSIGYVQVFLQRKKVKSFPVCLEHYAIAYGLIKLGQNKVRSFLAEVLPIPIKKGTIPRLKVSLTP